jgi:mono/diheme cytochrome c family protein
MARFALVLIAAAIAAPQLTPAPAAQAQPAAPAAIAPALDYEVFKTRVQAILAAPRKGNARCISCHARGGGNAFLEPLAPGSATYTEEQARRNFERIQRLVVPGEPLKSPLLVNPLAEEAAGSHWHGGGKHWPSQNDPEWQALATWVRTRPTGAASLPAPAPSAPAAAEAATSRLDYEAFRTRVQPILMAARKGNARCISCHARGGGNAFLEPLAPGSATYTEEQARRNFERIQRLVVPGEPLKSPLLVNPLAEGAGGSHWHGGGKHWPSQDNPEWQALAAWVRGAA